MSQIILASSPQRRALGDAPGCTEVTPVSLWLRCFRYYCPTCQAYRFLFCYTWDVTRLLEEQRCRVCGHDLPRRAPVAP